MTENLRSTYPLLTEGMAGIGGVIKACEKDFQVEEIPLYPASGEGTHVYAWMEKKGLSTMDALHKIARGLGVQARDIGYAGLKDAYAITRQWISIEHIEPQRLKELEIPNVKILETARHSNKLKTSHLKGNRFIIRVREMNVPFEQVQRQAQSILDILCRRGVPNYFGPQRFGNRSDTHILGKAIVTGEYELFMDLFLGQSKPGDSVHEVEARRYYDEGEYEKAIECWPGHFRDHRKALAALIHRKGNKKAASHAIDKNLKRLFVSAFQSEIFNRVVVARMPDIDRLLTGDMAYKHENGACFRVEDAQAEQGRCDRFEISPTGPLLGKHLTEATGPAGVIEKEALAETEFSPSLLDKIDQYRLRGGRRPLRFQPRDVQISSGVDPVGEFLELRFELDSGCYATTLLQEITKNNI
jgi:tRNA pseudouridine13 synthase